MAVGTKTQKKKAATKKEPIVRFRKGFHEMPIELLKKAEWNYKIDDDAQSRKLAENIKRNGQVENIIVRDMEDGTYEVVNGNHRYDAFYEAGIKTPMCFNLGSVSLAAAQRIAIETNETRFESDPIKLSEIINSMTEEFTKEDLLVSLPFDEGEFDSYASLKDFENEFDKKKENAEQDYENDFTGGPDTTIPIGKLLQSLNVASCNTEQAEQISEAVLRERMDLKIPIAQKDNTPALMSIITKYLEQSDAEAAKRDENRKRTARKRS